MVTSSRLIVLAVLMVGIAPRLAAQGAPKLPEGVTEEMIVQGKTLYAGAAGCQMCHGPEGKGTGMAAPMTDTTWTHAAAGTFTALVEVITNGRPPSGPGKMPMPAASAKSLTEAQVTALAAYVWRLSRQTP